MQETVEQTIATIRARNITLSREGDKIIADRPLLPDEKEVLKEHRQEALAIIDAAMPETAEQAYQRGQKDGYAAGVRDTLEQMKSRPPVEKPVAPTPAPTTPDEEIEKFKKWLGCKGDYYLWEDECVEALRAALVPGDRIQPMFAYSCLIIGADGVERTFKRAPKKKK